MNNIISMQNVGVSFGAIEALKDVSFEVMQGEIFGFLGPSGSGKTTTIKLLTGQLAQKAGNMQVFGKEVKNLSRKDYTKVGILSDNSGVYERLSVFDNLNLFAQVHDVEAARIDEVLEEVGLADQKKKRAKALSKGMRQRLLLAEAVLHKPQLLFLDEPTAALDPATATTIRKMMRKLNEKGTTIFLTTHNMEEADQMCARVAFLNKGSIEELDAPKNLKLKYADNKMRIDFIDGESIIEEKTAEGLARLAQSAKGKQIQQIHSLEPNLEEVFLKVTGRELV